MYINKSKPKEIYLSNSYKNLQTNLGKTYVNRYHIHEVLKEKYLRIIETMAKNLIPLLLFEKKNIKVFYKH